MREAAFAVAVPGKGSVSAIRTEPERPNPVGALFVYAPGAGAGLNDPFGAFLARELAARGPSTGSGRSLACVRFQFPYREAGRSGPDPPAVLEATWRAVVEACRARAVKRNRPYAFGLGVLQKLVDALGPGQPERLRDAHLPAIAVPTLFCSGTRDVFAAPEELRAAASKVRRASVHLLEGADHGFAGAKGSGRTRRDIWSEAVEATLSFIESAARQ